MSSAFAKIRNALWTIYENPVFVNAYVELADGNVIAKNWGDDINFHLVRLLTGRSVAVYFNTPIAMALKKTNYLCIGSTLNYLPTPRSIVWGAGVIDDKLDMREIPARIHAVRGPLSRDYLLSRNIPCPEVYGDPALLIPYFHKPPPPRKEGRVRIGLIPHYTDQESPVLLKMKADYPDIDVIDIVRYGKWTDFVDRVCACDAVLSTSLHGLIIAEAYGIPNYWVSVSDEVIGSGFKFRDFFASIGKATSLPVTLDNASNPFDIVSTGGWRQGRLDLRRLLDACPFDIREPIRYDHPMDV